MRTTISIDRMRPFGMIPKVKVMNMYTQSGQYHTIVEIFERLVVLTSGIRAWYIPNTSAIKVMLLT